MSINNLLYCVKMQDESGEFEIAAEFLESLELDFSSYLDKESQTVFHTVYALTPEEGKKNLELIQSNLALWREYGVKLVDVEYFEMKKEDWAEVWKKYFDIIHISKRLIIKPSWLDFEANSSQVIVQIDPGMSFGTGQHATTSYCLKCIDKLADNAEVKEILDAGCGSGILSIAAKKLGYQKVTSFDFDPEAIMVAKENFEINNITIDDKKTSLFVADAENYKVEKQYDFVVANILGHLLIKFKKNIASWVREDGYLTLAGILNQEFAELSKEFQELGFQELENFSEKEWTSGLFQKKSQ